MSISSTPRLCFDHVEILSICGGRFRLDGGAMFGLVPRSLWEPHAQPDSLNRLLLTCNCLLVREARELTLVDAGIGTRVTDREREIYAIEPGIDLPSSLALAGVSPDEVTRVVFTHLHFDHFCGALIAAGDTWRPAFPNAVHCVQEGEWRAALEGRSIMRTTYRAEELRFLQQQVEVDLLQGDTRLTLHLSTFVTGGHTEHHQGIRVQAADQTLVYPADIMSTRAHVRPYWGTSYDMFPYQTLERKQELLPRAAAQGWIVAWNHDPGAVWSRLRPDGDRVNALHGFPVQRPNLRRLGDRADDHAGHGQSLVHAQRGLLGTGRNRQAQLPVCRFRAPVGRPSLTACKGKKRICARATPPSSNAMSNG